MSAALRQSDGSRRPPGDGAQKTRARRSRATSRSVVAVDLRATVRERPALGDRGLPTVRRKLRGIRSKEMYVAVLALTWDGARCPIRSLPPAARVFLAGKIRRAPALSARKLSVLFADDRIEEIRLCWVPRLKGGEDVLCEPFAAPGGKRLAFRVAKITRFGDVLGVIYRRAEQKNPSS